MILPNTLLSAIDEKIDSVPLPELARAAERLIDRYRNPHRVGSAPFLDAEEMRLAYLAVRMPATFAAVRSALERTAQRLADWQPATVTDLMCGPATASWAACDAFPDIERVTLAERDPGFATLGRELATRSGHDALASAEWNIGALDPARGFIESDLVMISYGLCELGPTHAATTIEAAWAATRGVLLLVEPGTPAGFAAILAARQRLVAAGASIIAPCPHAERCPMPAEEWCHFAQRLPRTRTHRLAKGGNLGFEDEKYCYLAVSRIAADQQSARVVEQPHTHKTAVELRLCTSAGEIQRNSVLRRDKEAYKRAKKLAWGDDWPG